MLSATVKMRFRNVTRLFRQIMWLHTVMYEYFLQRNAVAFHLELQMLIWWMCGEALSIGTLPT